MSATPFPSATPAFSPHLSQQLRRYGPLVAVIGLHVAFFYALQSGLLHQAVQAVLPKEIQVSLISEQPAPQPAPPKAVPLAPRPVVHPASKPVVTRTPAPTAITEAVPPPQESKEPPSVAAPSVQPAPAAPTQPAAPKVISGIRYIKEPAPIMPAMSIKLGEEGVVEFRVLVNTQGRPEKVEIVKSSGFQRLDDAVIAAVKKAVFEPHIEDGKAITVSTTGKIGFTVPR